MGCDGCTDGVWRLRERVFLWGARVNLEGGEMVGVTRSLILGESGTYVVLIWRVTRFSASPAFIDPYNRWQLAGW